MGRRSRPPIAAVLALGAALIAPAPASAADRCEEADVRLRDSSTGAVASTTLCLLNAEREERGLRALRGDERLERAADRHAADMVRHDYFSHTSLAGSSFVERIRRTGYLRAASRWRVGENLAWGSGSGGTPRAVVRAWMRSRAHRANILDGRFHEIGVGVTSGAPRRRYRDAATYATSFGFRR